MPTPNLLKPLLYSLRQAHITKREQRMKKLEALGNAPPAARVAIVFTLAAAFVLLACAHTSSEGSQLPTQRPKQQQQPQQPQGPSIDQVRAWAEATKFAQNRAYEATKAAKEQAQKNRDKTLCHGRGGSWDAFGCNERPTPTPRR
jgi:biopolymer transport protein ExbD